MVPIRGVIPVLDRDEDAILRLIEDGRLRWAFNIALKLGSAMELRVFPQCVGDVVSGRECGLEFPDVAAALTGGRADSMSAVEISAALNASGSHVYGLIAAGELKACSRWKRGPGGSARVCVESFKGFLARRCWPVPVRD